MPLAAAVAAITIVAVAAGTGRSIASTVVALIVFTVGLQLGYLSIIAGRWSVEALREAFRRWWGT